MAFRIHIHQYTRFAGVHFRMVFMVLTFLATTFLLLLLWLTALRSYGNWFIEDDSFLQGRGDYSYSIESPFGEQRQQGRQFSRESPRWEKGGGRGYVLTLDYTGQQSAGIRALLSQQCWAGAFDLPLRIVEPYCIQSRLVNQIEQWLYPTNVHNPSTSQERLLKFDDFFDLRHFNNLSESAGSPPLVTWEDFVANAPRTVISVNIADIHYQNCLRYTERSCATSTSNSTKSSFTSDCRPSGPLDKALGHLQKLGFQVARNVCFNCLSRTPSSNAFSPTGVTEHIFGKFSPSKVTVVFNSWRHSIAITPECKDSPKCPEMLETLSERLVLSSQIHEQAWKYIKAMGYRSTTKTLGIMIRLEWYIVMHQHMKQEVEKCLHQVTSLLVMMKNKRKEVQVDAPLLAVDVGRFGSSTWSASLAKHNVTQSQFDHLVNEVKSLVSTLYRKRTRWDFKSWEDSFSKVTGGILDRGYVAALQSAIVSKASCLILVGGGSFQRLALEYYVKRYPDPLTHCVYYVGMASNWIQTFSKIAQGDVVSPRAIMTDTNDKLTI